MLTKSSHKLNINHQIDAVYKTRTWLCLLAVYIARRNEKTKANEQNHPIEDRILICPEHQIRYEAVIIHKSSIKHSVARLRPPLPPAASF